MIVGLLIGVFGTQYILEHTNLAKFDAISQMQAKTRDIKHKRILEYGIMFVISAILWIALTLTKMGLMFQGFIVGIVWGFIMFIFEDTIFDNARNTLR